MGPKPDGEGEGEERARLGQGEKERKGRPVQGEEEKGSPWAKLHEMDHWGGLFFFSFFLLFLDQKSFDLQFIQISLFLQNKQTHIKILIYTLF